MNTPSSIQEQNTLFGHPTGLFTLFFAEMWERFSYYGMKAILIVFMTQHMLDASGAKASLDESEATALYHLFTSAVYFTPILGALLADTEISAQHVRLVAA